MIARPLAGKVLPASCSECLGIFGMLEIFKKRADAFGYTTVFKMIKNTKRAADRGIFSD